MYIIDGIAYADVKTETIEIVEAIPLENMMMLLTFNNGEKRLFDASVLHGPVFASLRNPKIFNDVVLQYGVVTWLGTTIDCAPEYMYANSSSCKNC